MLCDHVDCEDVSYPSCHAATFLPLSVASTNIPFLLFFPVGQERRQILSNQVAGVPALGLLKMETRENCFIEW